MPAEGGDILLNFRSIPDVYVVCTNDMSQDDKLFWILNFY
jgi:hypothetical protein